jgi:hypothetical protein
MRWFGRFLYVAAIAHVFVAAVAYRHEWARIWSDGVFATVTSGWGNVGGDTRPTAAAAFFLVMAPFFGLVGYFVDRALEKRDTAAISVTGWWFIAVGVLGASIAPRTPFAVFPLFGILLLRARRT